QFRAVAEPRQLGERLEQGGLHIAHGSELGSLDTPCAQLAGMHAAHVAQANHADAQLLAVLHGARLVDRLRRSDGYFGAAPTRAPAARGLPQGLAALRPGETRAGRRREGVVLARGALPQWAPPPREDNPLPAAQR